MSLGEALERPQTRDVLVGGLESAGRWHAWVRSGGFSTCGGESFESTKLS